MATQLKGASLAAGLALYGSYRAFVPGPLGHSRDVQRQALRGGIEQVEVVAKEGSTAGMGMMSAAAVTAAGALALGPVGRRRASGMARQASAVAPASDAEASAAPPPFDPAKQLGVGAPLGFFDPAGFCKVGDEAGFRNLRSAEIKHGRVAMMGAVGALIQHFVQFPGFEKVPKGLAAVTTAPGMYGFAALVAVCGALELTIWKDDPAKGVDSIGDYGNPLQLGLGDPLGESEDMRNRELNNGRAAMFAVVGIIVAELATGLDAAEQLGWGNLTDW